jgi:hypothetical protein
MTLWVKLPIRLKHVETYVIKQKTIIGQALSSHFIAELRPLHTAFFAPYSCRQCLRFPGHSTSSEFPIHSLKHDWVEGLYSCLEFFSNVIYLALIKCMSLFLNKLQVWMLCLVVPTWYLLLSIFGFPKKWENTKNIYKKKYSEEIQKIIRAKKGCWSADQNLLRRFKNAKDWNLIVRALSTRKIQFEKEKSKIRCLWTQLNLI